MQYTKNDWRNRNRIKGSNGCRWLTVPVRHKDSRQRISEIEVARSDWADKHWRTLRHTYARAPEFSHFGGRLEALYQVELASIRSLTEINKRLLEEILNWLGSTTRVVRDFEVLDGEALQHAGASERLLLICEALGVDTYISGPAASNYLDAALFKSKGINVEWIDYGGYSDYPQLSQPFEPSVSIVDVLFNLGPRAYTALKSF